MLAQKEPLFWPLLSAAQADGKERDQGSPIPEEKGPSALPLSPTAHRGIKCSNYKKISVYKLELPGQQAASKLAEVFCK